MRICKRQQRTTLGNAQIVRDELVRGVPLHEVEDELDARENQQGAAALPAFRDVPCHCPACKQSQQRRADRDSGRPPKPPEEQSQ